MRTSVCAILTLMLLLASVGCKSETTQTTTTNTQPTTNTQTINATSQANASNANAQTQTSANTNSLPVSSAATKDVCSLLTSEEIQSIQGEAVKESKASESRESGLLTSQCFYTTPTFSKSINIAWTQSDARSSVRRDPKEFWEKSFGEYDKEEAGREKKKESEREKEKGKEKEGGARRGEEEEEAAPPQKIAGLGDEAFWTSSRVGGALYVLKGNSFIRVSLGGGPSDAQTRLNRAKALAEKVLKRL